MSTSATVILDSVSPKGDRLTTMEVTFHRFVLAEFNTHRVFSRNSASSRAIPVEKQLKKVHQTPAWPLEWPSEQPGMQGGSELLGGDLGDAQDLFVKVWSDTVDTIEAYLEERPDKSTRLHKSLVNRLLEPFMWHTVIVTATDWDGFWNQRCSPLAQPEIRVAAEAMHDAYQMSKPTKLDVGEWHTPYILPEEYDILQLEARKKISVARCARVSYLTHDGIKDHAVDLDMYLKLISARPMHASPLEHVATPTRNFFGVGDLGNLKGWDQLRHSVEHAALMQG